MTIEIILLILALVLIFLTKNSTKSQKIIKEVFAGSIPSKFYLKTDIFYKDNVKSSLTGGKYYYVGFKNNKLIAEPSLTKNSLIFTNKYQDEKNSYLSYNNCS